MRLKVDKTMRKSKITIVIETTDFDNKENRAIDMLGDPQVDFEANYSGYTVSIHKLLKRNFHVKVEFDGTDNIDAAIEAANKFCEEIEEKIENVLTELMDKFKDIEYDFKEEVNKYKPIKPFI